jgi:endoglucanase
VIQAEDGRLSGATFVSTHNGGYTGRGYVDFVRTTGDAAEWVLNADRAVPGRMRLFYANGSTSARSLRLTVNGQVVSNNVAFSPTGSWSTWHMIEVIVPLQAGDNTLRLDTNGSSGPNIDRIEMA